MIVAARIFFVGGLTSFRALFYWLTPWIYIPTMLIAPLFQILLFAYIGRSAALPCPTLVPVWHSGSLT